MEQGEARLLPECREESPSVAGESKSADAARVSPLFRVRKMLRHFPQLVIEGAGACAWGAAEAAAQITISHLDVSSELRGKGACDKPRFCCGLLKIHRAARESFNRHVPKGPHELVTEDRTP